MSDKADTIIGMIRICRKIEQCHDLSQLSQIIAKFTHIPSMRNVDECDINKVLLKVICVSKLKEFQLQEIHEILPSEKELSINDSLTKSNYFTNEAKDGSLTPRHLLQLPTDIKTYLFRFLPEIDVYSIEKCCRSTCIDARNPHTFVCMKISNSSKVNQYFRNLIKPRYNSVRTISIRGFSYQRDPTMPAIISSIQPLSQFSQISIRLVSFDYVFEEYDNFMSLFYRLLSFGNKELQLTIDCDGYNVGSPNEVDNIFNPTYNNLAHAAIRGVSALCVKGFASWALKLLRNVFCYDFEHIFESVKLDMEEVEYGDFGWDQEWDLDFVYQIAKCAHFFSFKFNIQFRGIQDEPNPVLWNTFVDNILESSPNECMDALSIRFEIYCTRSIEIAKDFTKHLKIWMKINRDTMKEIRLKSICIVLEYTVFDEENPDEILQDQNKVRNHQTKSDALWNLIHTVSENNADVTYIETYYNEHFDNITEEIAWFYTVRYEINNV